MGNNCACLTGKKENTDFNVEGINNKSDMSMS